MSTEDGVRRGSEGKKLSFNEKRITPEVAHKLADFITACAMANVTVRIEFDDGVYTSMDPSAEEVRGQQGFTLMVGEYTKNDPKTKREKLFRTMEELVEEGWKMLAFVLSKRK